MVTRLASSFVYLVLAVWKFKSQQVIFCVATPYSVNPAIRTNELETKIIIPFLQQVIATSLLCFYVAMEIFLTKRVNEY